MDVQADPGEPHVAPDHRSRAPVRRGVRVRLLFRPRVPSVALRGRMDELVRYAPALDDVAEAADLTIPTHFSLVDEPEDDELDEDSLLLPAQSGVETFEFLLATLRGGSGPAVPENPRLGSLAQLARQMDEVLACLREAARHGAQFRFVVHY